jgi:hypothetical protein
MPEARQNNSKLAEMLARASNFRALVGMAVDVVDLFMALLSFVESAPRAYRLKASNAAPPFSTSAGTSAQNVAVLVDLLQLGLLFVHLRRWCARSNRNCRYLKNCGQLSFLQVCQQRDLPVRELECIVMSSPPV